ncbi:MAG: carboxylesterase family protein, partial [Planctomycetota bacterium]
MTGSIPKLAVLMLAAGLALSFLASSAAAQGRGGRGGSRGGMAKIRKLVEDLELTREQQTQLGELVREYRGKLRSPEFREAFEAILTDEQKEILNKSKEEAKATAPPPEGVRVQMDIPYAEIADVNKSLLSLDLYAPVEGKNHPVVIFVHGGGWRKGDKSSARQKGHFFAQKGFVLVSVNYRLSPKVTHPAHIQDVAAAVKWVRDNVKDHGGNPEKLVV